jgi:hypothetical protein
MEEDTMQHARSGLRRRVKKAGAPQFWGTIMQPQKTRAAVSREKIPSPSQTEFYRLLAMTFILLMASAIAGVVVALLSFD